MQSAAWKHLWTPTGLEVVTLDGSTAEGDILWLDDAGRPHRLRYRVEWDARGHTRLVDCTSIGPDGSHARSLTASGDGQWWTRDGRELAELGGCGCMDVDLWPTPFTNTLPLRRLRLPEGQSVEITVAHVEAPDLRVRAKPQRYTALGDRRYRFESLDDGFSAEILLAGDDLVQRYEGLFERIA